MPLPTCQPCSYATLGKNLGFCSPQSPEATHCFWVLWSPALPLWPYPCVTGSYRCVGAPPGPEAFITCHSVLTHFFGAKSLILWTGWFYQLLWTFWPSADELLVLVPWPMPQPMWLLKYDSDCDDERGNKPCPVGMPSDVWDEWWPLVQNSLRSFLRERAEDECPTLRWVLENV